LWNGKKTTMGDKHLRFQEMEYPKR